MAECRCDMKTKLVGDGCEVCNQERALDCAKETIEELRAENDTLRNEARVYRAQCDMANEWRDKIEADLAALKEAARPVVKWWNSSPDGIPMRQGATEIMGLMTRKEAENLDALAALAGEE